MMVSSALLRLTALGGSYIKPQCLHVRFLAAGTVGYPFLKRKTDDTKKRSLDHVSILRDRQNVILEGGDVLNDLRRGSLKTPSDLQCHKVIKSFIHKDQIHLAARFIFVEMRKYNLQPTVQQFNTLLEGYMTQKRLDKVTHILFRSMAQRNVKADTNTCTIALRTFRATRHTADGHKFLTTKMEKKFGVKPTLSHFTTLIGGYGFEGKLDKMIELVKTDIPAAGLRADARVFESVLEVLIRLRRVEDAEKFLTVDMPAMRAKPTSQAYGVLVRAYADKGDFAKAEELLFKTLPEKGLQPHPKSINALMNSYDARGMTEQAEKLVLNMLPMADLSASKLICSHNLLEIYLRHLRVDSMEELVFDRLPQNGLTPDLRALTLLLQGYALAGRLEDAERLLLNDIRDNLKLASHLAFGLVMDGYAGKGDYEKVERLLYKEMKTAGLEPDQAATVSLLKAYVFGGQVEKAEKFVTEELQKDGRRPQLTHLNFLILGYMNDFRFQDAEDVLTNILPRLGLRPSWNTCRAILLGYLRFGDVRKARRFVKEVLTKRHLNLKPEHLKQAEEMLQSLRETETVKKSSSDMFIREATEGWNIAA